MNAPIPAITLDVITIGRCSVDLYGQQIGGRLEDMASFSKAVGGCPANIAIGAARLGLRSALISRVGDEHMGRFIREQLLREGVDVRGLKTDPARLTALVVLGVRDDTQFPLIFYRNDCADWALDEGDIDEAMIASARAVVVTGTHFSKEGPAKAQMKAVRIAKAHGRKVVFDVDYRPNLWGLAGHGDGESRYIKSDSVTAHLQPILPHCDLIVGTEEELAIAGGAEDTLQTIRNIRRVSNATIVCKRGPMGCVVFPGAIPDDIEKGIKGPGFPVEVYNVLGAGDAFMSGFLRGWLVDEPIETACAYANACGAFAVSRLLCAPEIPTFEELTYFLAHGSPHRALRKDVAINQLHWATTRRPQAPTLRAFAIDHRAQLEVLADNAGASRERIATFKLLAVDAAVRVAAGRPGYGMLLDGTYGRAALFKAANHPLWLGRPVEKPGSRPLEFDIAEGGSLGAHLSEWPVIHTAKCLAFYHPDDDAALRDRQIRELRRLQDAARTFSNESMIEIIAGKNGPLDDETVALAMSQLYDAGLFPDWWKLEPQSSPAAWQAIDRVVQRRDPHCRGVVVLGLEAPLAELGEAFAAARRAKCVRGFAVGRTIWQQTAEAWFGGHLTDAEAVDVMSERFAALCATWDERT